MPLIVQVFLGNCWMMSPIRNESLEDGITVERPKQVRATG
jgi:hypothetical protein